MFRKPFQPLARACVALIVLCGVAFPAIAQTGKNPSERPAVKTDEKAEAIIKRAVDALGGSAFLGVRSIVSEGNFTPYANGVATLPIKFTDYLVFPDRERTEFRGSNVRSIQTYEGERGWVFDALKRSLNDATPEQVADFHLAMRTSLDNLLRGWWRKGGGQLSYEGRREAGLARRNEVVRLTYEDGFSVDFEFDSKTGMPAKVVFKKTNAEGEVVDEEDRYAQFLAIQGVTVPFIIDHFRAGQQSSRINYQKVEFNRAVPDALFARPADIKAFK